jgi:hypothetical protein
MYLKIEHPTIEILDKIDHLVKTFDYNISGFELTYDILDRHDCDSKYDIYRWLQPRIFVKRYHRTKMSHYKNTTYWHDPSSSTKALRLYIRDTDEDIGMKDSCRFEVIHQRDSLKRIGINSIPDIISCDRGKMHQLFEHISLVKLTSPSSSNYSVKQPLIKRLRERREISCGNFGILS